MLTSEVSNYVETDTITSLLIVWPKLLSAQLDEKLYFCPWKANKNCVSRYWLWEPVYVNLICPENPSAISTPRSVFLRLSGLVHIWGGGASWQWCISKDRKLESRHNIQALSRSLYRMVVKRCRILNVTSCDGMALIPRVGSILDTVSEDTEDTAYLHLLNVS